MFEKHPQVCFPIFISYEYVVQRNLDNSGVCLLPLSLEGVTLILIYGSKQCITKSGEVWQVHNFDFEIGKK